MEKTELDELLHIIATYKCNKTHKTNCLSQSAMKNNIVPSECDLETRGKHRQMFIRLGIVPNAAIKGSALSQNPKPPIVIDNIFLDSVSELKYCFHNVRKKMATIDHKKSDVEECVMNDNDGQSYIDVSQICVCTGCTGLPIENSSISIGLLCGQKCWK